MSRLLSFTCSFQLLFSNPLYLFILKRKEKIWSLSRYFKKIHFFFRYRNTFIYYTNLFRMLYFIFYNNCVENDDLLCIFLNKNFTFSFFITTPLFNLFNLSIFFFLHIILNAINFTTKSKFENIFCKAIT